MKELLRTNNPVLISWLQALLSDSNIDCIVLDAHTSVLEGSAGAIPRRVMVVDEDLERAKRIVEDSQDHLYPGELT
ncbi:MAG: DUF2007 domain-containing protein [Proteobacteria bacterium]|nr:DUF2007 domain-containing protein [Pseudomonadota bacterium]